ncbi:hypothetical protein F8388_026188 [Cannabis sativa]|uniref:DUF4283 domain-containing protein n=1 Tax=Cannabis sativa TaxID=3483 RepID=A0A7J6FS17_CANSA|nr:hypothetical protein G4B88_005173 [Cannabis sativa]KAF4373357.1 hypothetical protein F8388_026188 [Cannabis sativa]
MEDLSQILNFALNLTNTETKIHSLTEIPYEPKEDAGEEPSAFLTIKLSTNCHFNEDAFKKRLHQMWPERYYINVLVKEPNFFTVEFGYFGDHKLVLIGQPWHFDYKLIVMTPFESRSTVTVDMLSSTPFWIQVFGIPFLHQSRALARKLCEILDRFIKFLAKCDSSSVPPTLCYDHTLKAKVRITSNPFYIANTRTTLHPLICHPHLMSTQHLFRLPQGQIMPNHPYNAPKSDYNIQHFSQARTASVGRFVAGPSNTPGSLPVHMDSHFPTFTTRWNPVCSTTCSPMFPTNLFTR